MGPTATKIDEYFVGHTPVSAATSFAIVNPLPNIDTERTRKSVKLDDEW